MKQESPSGALTLFLNLNLDLSPPLRRTRGEQGARRGECIVLWSALKGFFYETAQELRRSRNEAE